MPERSMEALIATREQVHRGARTLSGAEVWARSARARATLVEQILDVSDEQAPWTPSGEDAEPWTIAEVIRHILTSGTPNVIEALVQGRSAEKEPPSEINVPPALFDQLRNELIVQSQRLLSIGLHEPEPINKEATVEAFFFGHLNANGWTLLESLHDEEHAAQIAAIKASAGYPAFQGLFTVVGGRRRSARRG